MPRILVVDDNQDIRFIVREILKRKDYEIVEAANGLRALEALESNGHFDLILSDVRMAQMDGLQLLDQLKERGYKIPVVILTVYSSSDEPKIAIEKGAAGYLLKPFTGRQLIAMVEQQLAVATR